MDKNQQNVLAKKVQFLENLNSSLEGNTIQKSQKISVVELQERINKGEKFFTQTQINEFNGAVSDKIRKAYTPDQKEAIRKSHEVELNSLERIEVETVTGAVVTFFSKAAKSEDIDEEGRDGERQESSEEEEEEEEERSISKADAISILDLQSPEMDEFLEKAGKAQLGEIREWKGRKMQKTADGWKPVKSGSGKKEGKSIEEMTKDADKIKSEYEDLKKQSEKNPKDENLKAKFEAKEEQLRRVASAIRDKKSE
jgi:hypothetical protein